MTGEPTERANALTKLRSRKIVRWGIAYVAVAGPWYRIAARLASPHASRRFQAVGCLTSPFASCDRPGVSKRRSAAETYRWRSRFSTGACL